MHIRVYDHTLAHVESSSMRSKLELMINILVYDHIRAHGALENPYF